MNADTTIYVRIAETQKEEPVAEPEQPENVKDEVPKTGIESYIGIAVLAIMVSVGSIYLAKRKI